MNTHYTYSYVTEDGMAVTYSVIVRYRSKGKHAERHFAAKWRVALAIVFF